MPTLYMIRDWNKIYEVNRTRELKKLDWLPLRNKQDGDGYTQLVSNRDGAALFGCWIAMLQIASKCTPRGTLIRDGNEPHTSESLARISRLPSHLFSRAFPVLVGIKWLDSVPYEHPAGKCDIPAPNCVEGKGMESTEGNNRAAPDGSGEVGQEREFPEMLRTARVLNKWEVWRTHRRAFKKPKSWLVLFNEQVEWLSQFDEPKVFEILSASIRNGWQGLFEPKESYGSKSNRGSLGENPRNVGIVKGPTNYAEAFRRKAVASQKAPVARPSDRPESLPPTTGSS